MYLKDNMYTALIMMAGSSQRMNININKVFLKLESDYLFLISVNKFLKLNIDVILVVNEQDYEFVKELCPNLKIVIGGSTRQESVYNGLKEVKTKYTLIHDAARPFISLSVIEEVLKELKEDSAALVMMDVVDTIKIKSNDKLSTLNRADLIKAVTPQAALTKVLIECHQKSILDNLDFTDDISLIEKYTNLNIKLIKSNLENFKITTEFDYKMAKVLTGDKDV